MTTPGVHPTALPEAGAAEVVLAVPPVAAARVALEELSTLQQHHYWASGLVVANMSSTHVTVRTTTQRCIY